MSAAEEPTIQPTETKPVETPVSTEVVPESSTTVPETTPETAILAKDPEVVASNLEKAEPVKTEETAEITPATEDVTSATEESAAAPATTEKKTEGKSLLNFLKKHVPNPKTIEKKSPTVAATGKSVVQPESTTAKTDKVDEITPVVETPAIVEPTEEEPFEGGNVQFKNHGGFLGGSWKDRSLVFGKEDGYSQNALLPFVATHKVASYVVANDKTNAAWENAAHASVTGVGLLFLTKTKTLDIPLNIINLAEITDVTVNAQYFTLKTKHSGDYEFQTTTPAKAKVWKAEIEKRAEQAKLTRSAVVDQEAYKTALAAFKEPKTHATKTPEAVTSDEEGALSGEDSGKRPSKWSRRISGSFGRFTNPNKDTSVKEAAVEKKETSPAPVEPVVAEAVATAATTDEIAPVVETPAEPSTETAPETVAAEKKEKRKSLSGFGNLFKPKATTTKEKTPEPVPTEDKAVDAAPATVEAAVDTITPATEPVPETEETPVTEAPAKPEKSKRGSIFAGLIPKPKDKAVVTPLTNGEHTEQDPESTEAVTDEPVTETKETPKKDGLARRLTSSFSRLGRSKSPEKNAPKVADEAPKIDTAIESTPEATTSSEPVKQEEPLSTTEAPITTTEAPAEEKTAPVVSTLA